MTKSELKKMAYRDAAAWLAKACDGAALDSSLTENEENFEREYIRDVIVPMLEIRGL